MKLGPNSIAPIHQDKPSVWWVLALFSAAIIGMLAFVAAVLGVVL